MDMLNLIHSKIKEINAKENLFNENDKILVAVSGGADSVALLLSLKEFYPELSLYACHVNHMLRSDEADRDMHFVQNLCSTMGIPLEILRTDVAAIAKETGLSTELAARNVRYDYFSEVCQKYGCQKIATAHTLSDNAETVLFNITRGTGLSGLCGIPAKRVLCDDIFIIRPLLYVKRNEIEEYLKSKKQSFVTDSSNLTDDYTRNYFRHNVIPLLKQVNPSFEDTLKNTCSSLKDIQIFIDKSVNNNISNDISVLSELDDCILSRVIIELYSKFSSNTMLESIHVNSVISLVKNVNNGLTNGNEVCLPGSVSAIIDGGTLNFSTTNRNKSNAVASYDIKLKHGINHLANSGFSIEISQIKSPCVPNGYRLYTTHLVNAEKYAENLTARNRKDGDTVLNCGMHKKVKSLFTQNKTASDLRNRIPFICCDDEILIIPGLCNSDILNADIPQENNTLYIHVYTLTTL